MSVFFLFFFLLWVSTLWWHLWVLPGTKIHYQPSHTSAIKLSVQARLQTMQTHVNSHIFCLSLAVPFTIDALLSVCWCEYNTNTV